MEPTALKSSDDNHRIRRLPQTVINRIAAGEVVLRPSAALKELLENSLDAGAKNITVTARSGGMKFLRVADDGDGISPEDLPLLCQRFATSKLRTFDDLRTVATFGFRGEALASVSHVARVSVITKKDDSPIGYSASYLDGDLCDEPKACAATQGTTLIVEDLFYNLTTRRNALQSTGEEYRSIVDVVARYAIRYPEVAFVCKKVGEKSGNSRPDVRTLTNASSIDNIRAAFGPYIAQELVPVNAELTEVSVKIDSLVTKSSFNLKKRVFVLFINGRLVECGPLKRAIDSAYSEFLPKGTHPFAYVNISMRQEDIDVNVHPTKKEVRFLHETEIIDGYVRALLSHLRKSESSRTFLAQSVLKSTGRNGALSVTKPSTPVKSNRESQYENDIDLRDKPYSYSRFLDLEAGVGNGRNSPASSSRPPSRKRPSSSVGDLADDESLADDEGEEAQHGADDNGSDALASRPSSAAKKIAPQFLMRTGPNTPAGVMDVYLKSGGRPSSAIGLAKWRKRRADALPLLSCIRDELEELHTKRDEAITEVFKSHVFVGLASDEYALVQYKTGLLLVDIGPVVRELMYRQILSRFADLDVIRFDPPVRLSRVLNAHMKSQSSSDNMATVEECAQILFEPRDMLGDYFSIRITGSTAEDAELTSMPLVLQGIKPDMSYSPGFFYRLATEVDWSEEKPCLIGIASILADLMGYHWVPMQDGSEPTSKGTAVLPTQNSEMSILERREWIVQHVLFASLRTDYDPPRSFSTDKVVREITTLSKLYKVFERC